MLVFEHGRANGGEQKDRGHDQPKCRFATRDSEPSPAGRDQGTAERQSS